jgi:hypothetical protein
MRLLPPLLLLAAAADAQPPVSKDFARMKDLRDEIASRMAQLQEAEEYAKKPREEKIFVSFRRGDKKFENKTPLTGEFVVKTCLMKWEEVQRAEPSEAATRVLTGLPAALGAKYEGILLDKGDRYEASKVLAEALDSDFLHVRVAAIESLKKIYQTQQAFMYEPTKDKKADRRESIEKWKRYIRSKK